MTKPIESRPTPAPLDADAAFVVHLTDPNAASGRAEHVTSGRSLRFTSMTELRGFMQAVVARPADITRRMR